MNRLSQTVPLQFDTGFSPFPASEFDEALRFLAQTGFDGVELVIARPKEVDVDALLEKLRETSLTVTTLSTGQAYALDGVFLASFDKDVRGAAVDIIKGHIDLSAKIGFPPVTVGLLRGKLEEGEKSELLENFRQAMRSCVEHAQKLGVTLQLEPICSAETVLINSTYDALDFLASIGNPENVGILYDCFHSYHEDEGMPAAIAAAGGRITNVHLSDSHRGLPGYGDIDFGAAVQALRATGYKGAYALETLVIPDREFINQHCYESVREQVCKFL